MTPGAWARGRARWLPRVLSDRAPAKDGRGLSGRFELTSIDTAGGEGELPRRLRREIELRSLSRVAKDWGISRESLARYLALLDVQRGTRALIESKLSGLDAKGDADALPG